MILHILNRPPSSSLVYREALAAMSDTDRLLLVEDGVLGALTSQVRHFQQVEGRLFALREDLHARGLEGQCDASVQVVDVDGFVTLTEEADKTVSWF
ncbi:sulfurtransferase complex subunit TusB [Halomonas daqingensis]|uniref:Sulfurtransferase complex subunit TusB n=1 Tax=Billgrantia desiderata TaxID=52021 RepID=A0ABS9B0F0_9GAMM|nr:sulfurtransferase complex subunit TusB [Halomonas desiderata]MCE8011344.1 sulfurtransferase complex subunit TusB [Halomonas desiderata]MCE8027268.1 sulfurtransferase complex subunit TusB [Halomonas desiderata]MCE8040935.1 sulfurtransferase complex subunit TusB [Halomonas desiderata]MCE8045510.1 sulfurtransferase complex subunit TusB [Halomonas desiderata]NIC36134.1 sulfurtransferase complex subunit TusB [Halomonas desiderata]